MGDPTTFVPNLLAYWSAAGFASNVLPDTSGNGLDLTCTGVSAGTTNTGDGWGIGGVPIVTTSGTGASAISADTNIWKPLSDGSGSTFWAVIRPTTFAATYVLYDTGVRFSSDVGGRLQLDVDIDAVNVEFVNAGGDGYVIDQVDGNWHTWGGTLVVDVPHLLVYTLDKNLIPMMQVWVDGILVGQLNTNDRVKEGAGRLLSSADPSFPFRLFEGASGLFPFSGELAEAGVSTSVWDATTRSNMNDWVRATYGLRTNRSSPGVLVFDGNSLVDNFWRPDQWPPITTPLLKQRTFVNMRAIAGLTSEQMSLRAPTETIPNYNPNAFFNVLFAWEFVNSLAEGDTLDEAFDAYATYCTTVRTAGFKVVAVPLMPERLAVESDGDYINGRLLSEWPGFADALARPDLDPILGSWPEMIADYGGGSGPRIYRSDGIHFTALGNQMLVPYFREALDSVLPGKYLLKNIFIPLDLTGMWNNSYPGITWKGLSSFGSSGVQEAMTLTSGATIGASVNGFAPARFNGTNEFLECTGHTADYLTNTQACGWILFQPLSLVASSGVLADDPNLFVDSNGVIGIAVTSSGVQVYAVTNTGQHAAVAYPLTLNEYVLFQWKLVNQTTFRTRVNGGAWTDSPVSGSWFSLDTGHARMGCSAGGVPVSFANVDILQLATSQEVFSDSVFDDVVIPFINARYPGIGPF